MELDGDARAALLDQACGGDPDFRGHLQSLLEAHLNAGQFLHEPTIDPHACMDSAASPVVAASADRPGSSIGRYKLLEKIGEGGFGVVYMAQQAEPVRRRVALKIIKPGMDSRQVIARFEAERQALALMDHPSIARVLDAGETTEGRPFFVMELVRGEPITEYCDAHRLSPRERIELFVPVCMAVQHAHQKGVIHRDLKPANVLVTIHDDRPVPKIIDFGIAKAIERPLTDRTLFTEFRQFIGTPVYMSPEQAGRSGLDVDTRSDVYSLGVLLYELLTSTTPFDATTLRQASYDEIQRLIREVDPPRPSTRLATLNRQSAAASQGMKSPSDSTIDRIARLRRSDPQTLRRLLAGEVDWIVMKCLEKDRAQRYESAGDLAHDLQRHLRDEPIAAGPPSAAYRLRKLARRHRTMLVVSATIAFAILGGLGASIWGFLTANHARAVAEAERRLADASAEQARQEAAKTQAINTFLQEMLSSADPMHRVERNVTVREILDEAAKKAGAGQMDSQPEVAAAVRTTIGRAYRDLALYEPSEAQLRAALAIYERAGGPENIDVAAALQELASLLYAKGDLAESERLLRRALDINVRLRKPDDGVIATNLSDLATILMSQERWEDSERLLKDALKIARLPKNASLPVLPESLNNLAFVYYSKGRLEEAELLYRQALDLNRRHFGDNHPTIATNMDNLAAVLRGRGDRAGAEKEFRNALAMRRKLYGDAHPDVATTLHNLASLLCERNQWDEAEPLLRESLGILQKVHGLGHPDSIMVAYGLVGVIGHRHDYAEAERLLLDTYRAAEASAIVPVEQRQSLANRLSELYTAWGRPEEAERWKVRVATTQGGQVGAPDRNPAHPTTQP